MHHVPTDSCLCIHLLGGVGKGSTIDIGWFQIEHCYCRVPLTPELREVLEVAYVSKIMSKNFRKEGQPEKERIARITGMDIDKVRVDFTAS